MGKVSGDLSPPTYCRCIDPNAQKGRWGDILSLPILKMCRWAWILIGSNYENIPRPLRKNDKWYQSGKIFKRLSFIYFVTKEFWNSNPSSKIFKHMVPQIENNSRIGRLAIKYCILSLSEVTKYVVNRHLVPNHIRYVVPGAS